MFRKLGLYKLYAGRRLYATGKTKKGSGKTETFDT